MEYSTKLQLDDFFNHLQKENFVVIKMSDDFPNYFKGDDIDIFCEDLNSLVERTLLFGNKYVQKGGWEIRLTRKDKNKKIHIDFIYVGELEIRFDLHGSLPEYKKVSLKQGFFNSILKNKVKKDVKDYLVYVPSEIDEMVLRYIEFHEYFDKRPDKIKHLDYIVSMENPKFLEKLHRYVKHTDRKEAGFFTKMLAFFKK